MSDYVDDRWHLDKRIPITLVGAIIVQTFVFGWIASAFNSRVSVVEASQQSLTESLLRRSEAVQANVTAVLLIQKDINTIKDSQKELKDTIEPMERAVMRIEEKLKAEE